MRDPEPYWPPEIYVPDSRKGRADRSFYVTKAACCESAFESTYVAIYKLDRLVNMRLSVTEEVVK